MVYKCFDKKASGGAITLSRSETLQSANLATRATRNKSAVKRVIRKFKKRKVHSSLIDNIFGANLTDMHMCYAYDVLLIFSVNTHGLLL